MLGQRLGSRKWIALMLLMAGVSIVQLNKSEAATSASGGAHVAGDALEEEEEERVGSQEFLGFLAVFAAAVTSGFCGVYQQRILQRGGGNLWVRNAQMGITSVVFGLGSVLLKDIDAVLEKGFFQGYCPLVRKFGKLFLGSILFSYMLWLFLKSSWNPLLLNKTLLCRCHDFRCGASSSCSPLGA